MPRLCLHRIAAMFLVLITTISLNSSPASAQEHAAQPSSDPAANTEILSLPVGTLFPLNLDVKSWKHIQPGLVCEGHLSLPLYTRQQAPIPAGTTVRVTIDSVEKVRVPTGARKTLGRGIVSAFNPLDKRVAPEYRVKLKSAEIFAPGEHRLPLNVTVLRAGPSRLVQPEEARDPKHSHASSGPEKPGQNPKEVHSRLLLRLEETIEWSGPSSSADLSAASAAPAQGARGRAFLLNGLSASQNQEGDRFQALLAEPLRLGGQIFDAGTIVEGTVVRRAPPRIFSRAGLLYLRIDRLVSQQQTISVDGSLVAAESGPGTPPVLDDEGILRGHKPGMKNALVDLGIAYVLGKASDDIAETPIRAVGAAMSDAAVANAARYFGLAGSAVFLVARHGRDVRLPQYSEVEIDFGRVNQAVAGAN